MSYQTTAEGKIFNLANGKEVIKDITDVGYQNFLYWQSSGINLTAQEDIPVVVAQPVVEDVIEDVIVEPDTKSK